MKLIRPTWSDIRHVALRVRYAELLRLREFVKRTEDSTAGAVDIKLNEQVSPMRGRDRAEGEEEMSEPKTGLGSLALDDAIHLRWVLRDIIGKRLKFSPIAPNDLQTLIDLGYIEMKDEVPAVTTAGLDEIAIGKLPSDRGGVEGEK
jgi:hypothetical protein